MKSRRIHSSRSAGATLHIVGGGIMGLCAATAVSAIAKRLGIRLTVSVYEGEALGGGLNARTSAPRCQSWFHVEGVIYSLSQPHVAASLRRSTAAMRELAPFGFSQPLAFAVVPEKYVAAQEAAFQALHIASEPIDHELIRRWFPEVRLPEGNRLYQTRDGIIHLRPLALALKREAQQLGVQFIRHHIASIEAGDSQITALTLDNGEQVALSATDQVVLTCGPRIRSLLSTAGLAIDGLRTFQSNLIATYSVTTPALFAYVAGGPNLVPHTSCDGRSLCVFGDSARVELDDHQPVAPAPEAIEKLRRTAEDSFGVRIPHEGLLSWPGVKAEIVPPAGVHSQAHHALAIPGALNGWIAIPGKLSQSYGCAEELALLVISQLSDYEQAAWSIWDALAKGLPSGTPSSAAGHSEDLALTSQ